jgi:hypothetical protein
MHPQRKRPSFIKKKLMLSPNCICISASSAAGRGHLKCLEFFVEKKKTWYRWTTVHAAYNGHTACLQFCVENGCPLHVQTAVTAATHDHMECLVYIFENCRHVHTWEETGLGKLIYTFSTEIQRYLESVEDEWICYSNRQENIKG